MGRKIGWTGVVLGTALSLAGIAGEAYLYYLKPASLRNMDYVLGELDKSVCDIRLKENGEDSICNLKLKDMDLKSRGFAERLTGERLKLEKEKGLLSTDRILKSAEIEYQQTEEKYGDAPFGLGAAGLLFFVPSLIHLLRNPSKSRYAPRVQRRHEFYTPRIDITRY